MPQPALPTAPAPGAPTVYRSATCPDCGAPVAHQSGCERCVACGWSRCG